MLPDIGTFHPQIVHFAISLLIVGVVFRIVALTGRLKFTGPAATTLIIVGTVAAVLAARSGTDAHGPVERIPGARNAVEEHEEWGERARNIFLLVTALELIALAVSSRTAHSGAAKGIRIAGALIGLAGVGALYEAGEHGGALVYSYAGGVGTRSGSAADVENTLVAGLYNAAMAARAAGKKDEAAHLFGELYRIRPGVADVQLLQIESILRDRGDAQAALAAIAALPAGTDTRMRTRVGLLQADAYMMLGQRDEARVVVQELLKVAPDNRRVKAKADSLQ